MPPTTLHPPGHDAHGKELNREKTDYFTTTYWVDPETHTKTSIAEQVVDTDGVCFGLYYHLWKKTASGKSCPDVYLPHTVLYEHGKPVAWYFTSMKDKELKRKRKTNVEEPQIAEALTNGLPYQSEEEIASWFTGSMTSLIASPRKQRKNTYDFRGPLGSEVEAVEAQHSLEYLTVKRTQNLLAPGQYTVCNDELYEGVLQHFVQPRDDLNHMIRATWSPKFCVLERRQSKHKLHDPKEPLSTRLLTWEGPLWSTDYCQLAPGVLPQRLTALCNNMARHIRDVSEGHVVLARMHAFFKVDEENRIWLLFASNIVLDTSHVPRSAVTHLQKLASQRTRKLQLVHPDLKQDQGSQEEEEEEGEFMCAMTGSMHPKRERVEVTYKMLMQQWFTEASTYKNEADRIRALDNLPPAIRRANPQMTREHYLKQRSQPAFMMRTAQVCGECGEELAKYATSDLAKAACGSTGRRVRPATCSPTMVAVTSANTFAQAMRPVMQPGLAKSAASVSRPQLPQRPSTTLGLRSASFGGPSSRGKEWSGAGPLSIPTTPGTPEGPQQQQQQHSTKAASGTGSARQRGSADGAGPVTATTLVPPRVGGGLPLALLPRSSSMPHSPHSSATSSSQAEEKQGVAAASVTGSGSGSPPTTEQGRRISAPGNVPLVAAVYGYDGRPGSALQQSSARPQSPGASSGSGSMPSSPAKSRPLQAQLTPIWEEYSTAKVASGDADSGGGRGSKAAPNLGTLASSPYNSSGGKQQPSKALSPYIAGSSAASSAWASPAHTSPPRSSYTGSAPSTAKSPYIPSGSGHPAARITSAPPASTSGPPPVRPPSRERRASGQLPNLNGTASGRSHHDSGDLNSTSASSRNTSAAYLSNDDLRTLKELSQAYSQAESMTQQLLAQAQEVLAQPVHERRPSHDWGSSAYGSKVETPSGAPGSVHGSSSPTPQPGVGASRPSSALLPSSASRGSRPHSAAGKSRPASAAAGTPPKAVRRSSLGSGSGKAAGAPSPAAKAGVPLTSAEEDLLSEALLEAGA